MKYFPSNDKECLPIDSISYFLTLTERRLVTQDQLRRNAASLIINALDDYKHFLAAYGLHLNYNAKRRTK